MKKFASVAISGLMLVSALTACGTSTTAIDPAALAPTTGVSAQSAKKITLSMDKKNSSEVKKASTALKNATFKIGEKKDKGTVKATEKVVVTFTAPTGKNDFDSQNYASIARYSLQSMNQASTYQQGYTIGMQALMSMGQQNVYIARVSWSAANATQDWQNGYKVVSAALNHIAAERPNTAYDTCQLVMTMMGSVGSYSDAYKLGFAAMQVIGQTDNQSVRFITDLALRQAQSTTDWQDGYNVLRNAFQSLSNVR